MSLIDRYVIKLYIGYLLGGIVVFVTFYLVADVLGWALPHFEDASSGALFRYYFYQLPEIIYRLAPVACLVATLFTFSSLHRSNEMVALFSAGYSLSRIAAPALILTGLFSALLYVVSDQIIPRFNQKKHYVEYVEIEKRPGLYSTVKTNRIWYRAENVLFNIKTLNPEAAKAQGVTFYYFDNAWNLVQLITAAEVDMRGHTWDLKNGFVTLFATESSFPLTKPFTSKLISMNEDLGDLQSTTNSSDVMTVKELGKFIERNKEAGLDTMRYEVDYHKKFGFAFAAFVMALLGVPFSVKSSRSGGAMMNVGICCGLAFAYWALYSSFETLGKHGSYPPLLAAWTANLLMVGLSVFLLKRMRY